MNVPCTLFNSRACTTKRGNSCGCSAKKALVKLGAPFSVRGYLRPILSNAFFKEAAAHISTPKPATALIFLRVSFSRFKIACLVRSARSVSTRTPRHVMSSKHGNKAVSNSHTELKSSLAICTLNNCHNSRVSCASISA